MARWRMARWGVGSGAGWGASDLERLDALAGLLGVQGSPMLRAGWEATAGKRGADRMEDRHVVCSRAGVTLAAVFDGHGGDAAAEYCRLHLSTFVLSHWRDSLNGGESGGEPAAAASMAASVLRSSFNSLHEGFLAGSSADDSGCTALVAIYAADMLTIANAGDCQCHLWRGSELLRLTNEHTAALPSERARVEAAGASVSTTSDGKLRAGGIIQVTRCIGDKPLRHLGLTSEPETHILPRTAEDKAIVMASDGLWDVMSSERVLHCLNNTALSPDLIAKRLLTEALDRGEP